MAKPKIHLASHPCNGVWGNTWYQFSYTPDPKVPEVKETLGVSINDAGVTAGLLEPRDGEMRPVIARLPLHGEVVELDSGVTLQIVDADGVVLVAKAC